MDTGEALREFDDRATLVCGDCPDEPTQGLRDRLRASLEAATTDFTRRFLVDQHIHALDEQLDVEAKRSETVEAVLAQYPDLSERVKNRVREQFPDVCCPAKVQRAVESELAQETVQEQAEEAPLSDPDAQVKVAKTLNQVLEDLPEDHPARESVEQALEQVEMLVFSPDEANDPSAVTAQVRDVMTELPEQRQRELRQDMGLTGEERQRESAQAVGTMTSRVRLLEGEASSDDEDVFRVAVLQAGESLNGRYYPPEVLEDNVGLFEGKSVQAYRFDQDDLNHLPEELEEANPGGALGNKVGQLQDCEYDGENERIACDLHVLHTQESGWFKDLLSEALRKGQEIFGFSISAKGESIPKRVRNRVVDYVESIQDVFSVDAVSEPAAGGRVLAKVMSESVGDPWPQLRKIEQEADTDGGKETSGMSATDTVRRLAETLESAQEPEARGVSRELRRSLRLDRAGQDVDINVDRVKRKLESIEEPSRPVGRAIQQLNEAAAKAVPVAYREQDDGGDGGENGGGSQGGGGPQGGGGQQAAPPQGGGGDGDAMKVVEEVMGLLEGEDNETARAVHQTLKDAKEASENGEDVTLDLDDLINQLDSIEEPSPNVQKAVKTLKDEKEKREGGGGQSGSSSNGDKSGNGQNGGGEMTKAQEARRRARGRPSRTPRRSMRESAPAAPNPEVNELREQVQQLQSEVNGVKQEKEQLKKDLALTEHQTTLEQHLTESNLTETFRQELRDELWNTPKYESEIKEAIAQKERQQEKVLKEQNARFGDVLSIGPESTGGNNYSWLQRAFGRKG